MNHTIASKNALQTGLYAAIVPGFRPDFCDTQGKTKKTFAPAIHFRGRKGSGGDYRGGVGMVGSNPCLFVVDGSRRQTNGVYSKAKNKRARGTAWGLYVVCLSPISIYDKQTTNNPSGVALKMLSIAPYRPQLMD